MDQSEVLKIQLVKVGLPIGPRPDRPYCRRCNRRIRVRYHHNGSYKVKRCKCGYRRTTFWIPLSTELTPLNFGPLETVTGIGEELFDKVYTETIRTISSEEFRIDKDILFGTRTPISKTEDKPAMTQEVEIIP